jgi:hypothetical protein
MRPDGLSILRNAARPAGDDSQQVEYTLTTNRLGPHVNDVLSALAYAADHTTRKDLQLAEAKMLDTLNPEFREMNPLAAELEQQRQSEAFRSKVTSGGATIPEVLDGLKKFPETAPAIANYYVGSTDSNVTELLPAFNEALSALAPAPGASRLELSRQVNERQRLANAMQKIAPELPKPLFTAMDTRDIVRIMRDPVVQADPVRLQRVSDACKLAEWPGIGAIWFFDVPPDEMRRLLAAMKDADPLTYDAMLAKVMEIDPHFTNTTVGTSKTN